ncbi:MAG: polyprenyl synthetase family protein [Lachnospiraceae bacterium]|nr:polyprenyl synthetase family protein [Lachnospiraceae bacterium]
MNFHKELEQRTASLEEVIRDYLPKETGYQKTVLEAMNYSLQAGGKRLRPMMMQEIFHAYGGEDTLVQPFVAAIEMIHTYSLVHDDLPEMDNDELRRGLPTTHVKYGQAMAVLAGDALLNYSMEILLNAVLKEADPAILKRMCYAMQVLYHKAGIHGMIGGQTKDVEAEKKGETSNLDQILFIDRCKTAALIQASLMIGAILAGAPKEDIASLEKVGYNLGVAFQIQDDILDITSTTEELGKPVGSDEKNHKMTYVSYRGLAGAKEDQKQMSEEAIRLLDALSATGSLEFLTELMKQLMERKM